MRLLVTGGAGFIGSHVCRRAAGDPGIARVVVLDNLSTGDAGNLAGLDVELIAGSVLDDAVLDRACHGVDAVIHLAAIPGAGKSIVDIRTTHETNVTGTVRVLEAVRRHQVPYLVVASSSTVYGANRALPNREDTPTRPLDPDAASKLATEAYALAYATTYGMSSLVLRFFNVYGPGQRADLDHAAVVPRFLAAALRDRPVEVHGDGRQSRDFTFVGTVSQVLLDAVRRRVRFDLPVNLAFGESVSVLDLLASMEVVLGRPIGVRHTPARPGEIAHSKADGTLLRELFPDITPTPLPDGLRRTLDHLSARAVNVVADPRPGVGRPAV
jgi:UDP-glucose 4-epimerase